MESEWKKGHSSDTKYPEKAFSGIVKAMYPSFTKNNKPCLNIDFEDEKQISFFTLKVEEGEIKAGWGLDEFLDSLQKLGIEDYWATEPGSALGFRTEPDLVGCKIWMQPIIEQKIGDETQTKQKASWGILEKYEKLASTPAPVPKANPKSKPVPAPATPAKEPTPALDAVTPGFDAVSALKDFLLEYLDEPKTEAAIMQAVKKLENGKQMNDVRKPVLGDRTFISVENGKYGLVV